MSEGFTTVSVPILVVADIKLVVVFVLVLVVGLGPSSMLSLCWFIVVLIIIFRAWVVVVAIV